MRVIVRATRAGTVGDLDKSKPHLSLATDSQEVDSIKEYFGNRPAVRDFDGFLISVKDGDYEEVYGFEGNIAYVYKPVFKITRTFLPDRKTKTVVGKVKRKKGRGSGAAGIGGVR